jgi:murein endopeptidase
MIYGIMRAGQQWASLPRQQGSATRSPVLGIGDISFQNGGPISGHVSHQKGVDVDVRLARNDGRNAPTDMKPGSPTRGAYSRQFTAEAVQLFRRIPATLILLNDRSVPGTTWDRKGNHYNHFHVRIAEGQ